MYFHSTPLSPSLQVAVGHEGGHAVLLADDGGAFFVGTAKRGEDGDASAPWKGRRAPKPVKPKKMTKMDAVAAPVVGVVANSGTSALITRDGAVFMFGKVGLECALGRTRS